MKRILAFLAAAIGLASGAFAATIDLSTVASDITVANGATVTGTLGGKYKVTIAAGATVTLKDMTILGESDGACNWAGLTCAGDATIILEGANTVRGFSQYWPGIFIPWGSTLTIDGDGSLTASSNGSAPGIGSAWSYGDDRAGGNIIINGGTIKATGGTGAAAIGGGSDAKCGSITIGKDVKTVVAIATIKSTSPEVVAAPIGRGYAVYEPYGEVTVYAASDEISPDGLTRTITGWVDLAALEDDVTVPDGVGITGVLAGNYKVTIANGAKVTLKDATIEGVKDSSCKWAGITCDGDATIVLKGANSLKGFDSAYPGISVSDGSTLTIEGDGSLDASSNGFGPGIGGTYYIKGGNIVIKGGDITATGGSGCAGIGGGYGGVGNITIEGGTVAATGGRWAAAIGGGGVESGECGGCGTIDIKEGTVLVAATRDVGWGNYIGAGCNGTSGEVSVAESLCDLTSGYTRTISSAVVNLSTLVSDVVVEDGYAIMGTLAGNYKVTIANGATVTLKDATINGVKDSSCPWAGITCEGDATIVLKGANSLKGFDSAYPGIFVPAIRTLTIEGDGSLDASSNGSGPGIGGTYYIKGGNIVIKGGDITATGGSGCAGIGGGYGGVGNITIEGGTVAATGGRWAAAIGGGGVESGECEGCGAIFIKEGVVLVTATRDVGWGTYIGAGRNASSGLVSVAASLSDNINVFTRTILSGDLSQLTGNATMTDGTILTGTLAGSHKITIADGATVTLKNVRINPSGDSNASSPWAGITCEGDATIILEGESTVKALNREYSGIFVPVGKTLTIEGDGSLAVTGGSLYGAGIGSHYTADSGNVVIDSGTVTATGGGFSAGIGSSNNRDCGDITINGGTVTATGSDGGAGIGGGNDGDCGNITINGGTVVATGSGDAAGIGSGFCYEYGGCCGYITIGAGISSVVATCGEGYGAPIGSDDEYAIDGLYVDERLDDTTSGDTRTITARLVDLGALTEDYTARHGDVMSGSTTHSVTIPAGASVVVNGVALTAPEGGAVLPAPAFEEDGATATTKFVHGGDGKWTLTTFAELANDALGKDVQEGQIKVYAADSVAGLKDADPLTSGVEVKGRKSAVMATIEVTAPDPSATSQFFKVTFGE